jgi:sigma-B regulation protein RsbU (phosphoserine phosphatase)
MAYRSTQSNTKIAQRVAALFGLLIILAITCMILVNRIVENNQSISELQTEKNELLSIGDQLRQSSDDLTRMARLYVSSGDTNYLAYYHKIVHIRDGQMDRPIDYAGVYWDFVLASGAPPRSNERSISFIDLLKEKGAGEDQLEFFEQAKSNSDELVAIEIEAFQALHGRFKDDAGNYSIEAPPNQRKAMDLLISDDYHVAKARIMKPIQEFMDTVESDHNYAIGQNEKQNTNLFIVLFIIIGFACVVMALAAMQLFLFSRATEHKKSIELKGGKQWLEEIRNNWTLILATVVVCLGIGVFNFLATREIVKKTEDGLVSALKASHATSKRSVTAWLEGLEDELKDLREYHEFKLLTTGILSHPFSEIGLDEKVGLNYLNRAFIHDHSYLGYLLVSQNGEQLDDIRMNEGSLILSSSNHKTLEHLLKGEQEISFEMPLKLNDSSDIYNRYLKIGTPIRKEGKVIGALVLLFLPDKTFSDFLQNGRIGATGETTAFNAIGQLISESRFDEELREKGLASEIDQTILHVSMRVPGPGESNNWPLTEMAQHALTGQSGRNIKGYQNYRGEMVAGIWSWEERFGFGITTEMDMSEAFEPQLFYRRVLSLGSFLSIFLLLVLMILSIRSRIIAAGAARELGKAFDQVKLGKEELEHVQFLNDTALDLTKAGYWHVPLDGSGFYYSSEKTAKINGDPFKPGYKYHMQDEWFVNLLEADEDAANKTMKNFNEAVVGRRPFYDAVYGYKRPKDGNVVYLRAIGKVKRAIGGKATDMYGVTQDITDHVLSQRKLSENEDRLRLSQNIGHIGSWDWVLAGEEVIWSEEMYNIFGLEIENFQPTISEYKKCIHPEDRDAVDAAMTRAIEEDEEFNMEHRIVLGSGTTRYIKQTGKSFKDDNGIPVRFIGTSIDITESIRMQKQLERAFDTIKEQNERMSGELNVANDIQMSMLPLIFPAFPSRADIDIYANLIPAREVGGDFYDFFFIDEEHLCVVVGDVSGKGVPAALMMAVCKTVIKSRASNDLSPASILTHVNGEMAKENKNYMFITVFLAILNTKNGKLVYCNAGHNPSYVIPVKGNIYQLKDLHGPVIAAVEGIDYKETIIQLAKGDYLFAYTDGIPEAHNTEEKMYTDQKLLLELSKIQKHSSQKYVEDVISSVVKFENGRERFDDITALCVKYVGAGVVTVQEALELTIGNKIEEIKKALSAFDAFSTTYFVSKNVVGKVKIALDELLANIIQYAFNDDRDHFVHVEFQLHDDKLIIILEDDGSPFDPFHVETPDINLSIEEREIGGLGIHLVKNVMDEVNYRRALNKNIITLVKFGVLDLS